MINGRDDKWKSRHWFLSVWAMVMVMVFLPFGYIGEKEFAYIVVSVVVGWTGRKISKSIGNGGNNNGKN